ncbi:MAG: exodeoxyribonuclease V subunit beta [Desulfuromonadaceae bacterium]|nr:exodeoxyribonuclease V subunit beta [Desulfuromonadaceae bacterium]MDD5107212.1 exodeoxyribonuclease V subunit beta [Desulfuromonadaceae bacterium]
MNAFDTLAIDPSGCNLIEASAGTGKTYAIASLYVRLVVENERYRTENILVVTFTEAATKELRDRIRRRLREARDAAAGRATKDPFLLELMSPAHPGWPGHETALLRLELALQTFDCAAISTIHGFCSRVLQENAFESGSLFETELVSDQRPLIRQIVDDFWRTRFFVPDAPFLPLAETERWSPEKFVGFLKGKLTNPALRIIPEFTPAEIDAIRTGCSTVYRHVCGVWLTRRTEIGQILLTHPGLSRNQRHYRDDALPVLLEGMDSYVSQGNPFALFDGWRKLTARYMRENRLKKDDPPAHLLFTTWDELSGHLDKMVTVVHAELLTFAKQRLPERKAALNVRFFDDLLSDLHRALSGSGGVVLAERMRGKYRAALIDEFQDTDQIQYKIFRSVFKEGAVPLFLIGDPKQAIYSFRGADIYAYLEAREDVQKEHQHTMTHNWRSSGKLIEAVNRLFSLNRECPLVIDGLSYPEVSAPETSAQEQLEIHPGERDASPLQIWFFQREPTEKKCITIGRAQSAIVAAVTNEIAGLLSDAAEGSVTIGDREVVPGDIAVIVRGHKQARLIYDALQSRGIPAVVRSELSVFQTPEALELRTVLAALSEPGNERRVRTAMATGIIGATATEIARTFTADGEAEWERRLTSFREYHDLWKHYGFTVMFRAFLDAETVRYRLLSLPGGERSITNLLQCGELLHAQAAAAQLGVDALFSWLSEQVAAPPEGEEQQIRLESDEKAVKILTIHVSKGLEFPIVFCPFLWGGVVDNGGTVVAHEGFDLVEDFGSDKYDQHHRAALDEGLAENIRLLYVALTRAKYRCYVAWGRFRYAESSALAYLLHAAPKSADSSAYHELVKIMDTIVDSAMIEKLQSIASAGLIHLTLDPAGVPATELPGRVGTKDRLTCRTMTGTIEADWRVASFSSLADSHALPPELPDHDSSDTAAQDGGDEPYDESSILAFPKGANPGTFLHSVFEKVDFASHTAEQRKKLVARLLENSLFGVTYTDMVDRMLTGVLEAELSPGVRLSELQPGSWIQEMEFYFPLKALDPQLLTGFFRRYGISVPVDLARMAERLNFQRVKGMLLGFVDLVFCHGGRYYIVDWKSNHLGSQSEQYNSDSLAREMERKLYPLQYLLYTVAVNRHLERRISDYRYETHFGGVFYLFLRGIDNAHPGNGIYYDKPDAALIQGLTQCLINVGDV